MKSKLSTILLVEDDIFLITLYSTKFSSEGYQVFVAENAKQALKDLETLKPSLIILDIMLPDEDGIELLKKIKREKETASIPTVILSNLSNPSYREQALIYGAEDFWIKMHFDPSEIVAKANAILKHS